MTIRMRVSLVAIVATLLVTAFLLVAGQISQGHVEKRFEQATITGKTLLWKKIIDSQLDHMVTGTSSLNRDRATRKALKAKDTVALADSAQTTYNLLSASNVLSRLQLTDLDGKVLFSAPTRFSGVTQKNLVTAALNEGKIKQGIERDDDGKLLAIVTFPIYTRGKAIGVGVFARNLDAAIADFKKNDKSDLTIINGEGQLEYTTNETLYQQTKTILPGLGANQLSVAKLDGRVFSVATMPVEDFAGNPVAYMVSIKDYSESYAAQRKANVISYVSIFAVLVIALSAVYWFMARTLNPLRDVVSNLQDIAKGNLTTRIKVTSNDEIGQLQSAMQDTSTKLSGMISHINDMTTELTNSAEEMRKTTDESCEAVQRQQKELDQVSIAMNEMSITVGEVAQNANNAAEAARSADHEAQLGREVVANTISGINELANEVAHTTDVIHQVKESSTSIGSILDVIRGIADQTNLLALNAAIEAARAGEQGRGFAVVADEVRNLASKTQHSTQEIQDMIERLQSGAEEAVNVMEASGGKAQSVVEQAEKAGDSLNTITEAVSSINDINVQIASASDEQSAVAEEINRNVSNISQVAELSAQNLLQSATASTELNRLSIDLKDLVDQFRVK